MTTTITDATIYQHFSHPQLRLAISCLLEIPFSPCISTTTSNTVVSNTIGTASHFSGTCLIPVINSLRPWQLLTVPDSATLESLPNHMAHQVLNHFLSAVCENSAFPFTITIWSSTLPGQKNLHDGNLNKNNDLRNLFPCGTSRHPEHRDLFLCNDLPRR